MHQEEIIAGLKKKDRKAIEFLYEKYSRALCAVISRIISDPSLMEEVYCEAFLKIARNINGFDESKGHFYSWMVIICRECAKEKMRFRNSAEKV